MKKIDLQQIKIYLCPSSYRLLKVDTLSNLPIGEDTLEKISKVIKKTNLKLRYLVILDMVFLILDLSIN